MRVYRSCCVRCSPIRDTPGALGEPVTVTLRLRLTYNRIQPHQVRCGDEPDDSDLPSTTKSLLVDQGRRFGATDA